MAPDELARLVATAVGHALDHRHRQMVREAATAALVIALVVVLPLTLLQNSATDDAAHVNSVRNCTLVRSLGGIVSEFVRSDALDRTGQETVAEKARVLRAFAKIIEPKFLKHLSDGQQQLDKYTIEYWRGPEQAAGPFKDLQPLTVQLAALERHDCSRSFG